MTQITIAELSNMFAFVVTILIVIGCGIHASVVRSKEGKLGKGQFWKVLGIFCFLLFSTWATAGYINGDGLVESGLRPFGLVLRALPYLLKAL